MVLPITIKLVAANNPDKILFVGEALVGNEAVDQLTKFDRALRDFSSASGVGKGRGIDGMLVTKWDTVDDKVRLGPVLILFFFWRFVLLHILSNHDFHTGKSGFTGCTFFFKVSPLDEKSCERKTDSSDTLFFLSPYRWEPPSP
jgi:hypothetical protein